MSDEITIHDGDPMKALQLAAMNINGLSQQMGLVVARMDAQDKRIAKVKAKVDNISSDYGDRIKVLEEDEALKPYMQSNVLVAVRTRVAELLGIKFDKRGGAAEGYEHDYKHYFNKFCGRLHNDAKHAGIEASSWRNTPRKNYRKLIEFISEWIPARGVDGLKSYYDALESV